MAALSAVSPYNPLDTYVVALDAPPSWAHPFGTTSRGQDTFWLLTFAMRNTLLFGIAVAILSRIFSLAVGLDAGYLGGWTDRVLMSINDTFIVIPLFPLLVLFYFVMRDYMSWALLALVMASLGWAYDARLDPLADDEPEDPRVHPHRRLLGHAGALDHAAASTCPSCCRSCSRRRSTTSTGRSASR